MTVVTRFAPSPTGFLHIGGARTALFSWLYARRHQGKFLLRIEDTDRARSTQDAIDAILRSMKWLGLDWDGEETYQFARQQRHAEVAHELLKNGHAYHCYCTQEELEAKREKAMAEKRSPKYDGTCRNLTAPREGMKPTIRLKAPQEGEVIVRDGVQGEIHFAAEQLDDMIMLRSDGTPVYMLAVVVDDHDMGVTHIIRGDDHLTNAARQSLIYQGMGWNIPEFSHVPMIHGPDGAKLSKRHGALGVEEYEKMGFLPETLRNYLLRLGWSHGDDEIISTQQAIEWFNIEGIGKSPSRLDLVKLENLNGHYIREADNARLVELTIPHLEQLVGSKVDELGQRRLLKGMDGLKQRAKTIIELADMARFYVVSAPLDFEDKAVKVLKEEGGSAILSELVPLYEEYSNWTADSLQEVAKEFSERKEMKLGKVAQPLRVGLSGRTISPSVFEMMEVLGKEESLARLRAAC